MKLKYLIVFLFLWSGTKAQLTRLYYTDIDFKETMADTISGKIDSMLIIGMGSSLERIFLNDLSDKLIKDLSKKKIATSYLFIGKKTDEAKEKLKETNIDRYDAILFLRPTDTATFDVKWVSGFLVLPGPVASSLMNITVSRPRDTYIQAFDFSLYRTVQTVTKIWQATADIDCEPGRQSSSNKMAKKILARLKTNKYVVE